jgi:hypothetical protein
MVTAQQFMAPQQYAVSPQQYTGVAPAQAFDFSSLINLIIPIFALGLLMAMLTPMMKGFSEGFGGGR